MRGSEPIPRCPVCSYLLDIEGKRFALNIEVIKCKCNTILHVFKDVGTKPQAYTVYIA